MSTFGHSFVRRAAGETIWLARCLECGWRAVGTHAALRIAERAHAGIAGQSVRFRAEAALSPFSVPRSASSRGCA